MRPNEDPLRELLREVVKPVLRPFLEPRLRFVQPPVGGWWPSRTLYGVAGCMVGLTYGVIAALALDGAVPVQVPLVGMPLIGGLIGLQLHVTRPMVWPTALATLFRWITTIGTSVACGNLLMRLAGAPDSTRSLGLLTFALFGGWLMGLDASVAALRRIRVEGAPPDSTEGVGEMLAGLLCMAASMVLMLRA